MLLEEVSNPERISNVPMGGAHQFRWRCSIQVLLPDLPILWATSFFQQPPLFSAPQSLSSSFPFILNPLPPQLAASPLSYPSLSFMYEYFFSWPTFLWATVPLSRRTLPGTIWILSSAGSLFYELFLFSCLIQPFGHASMAFHIGRARATTIWQLVAVVTIGSAIALYTSRRGRSTPCIPLCRCRSVLSYQPLVKANRKPLVPECWQKAHAAPATGTQVFFPAMWRPSTTNPTSHKAESSQPFRTSKRTCSLQKCAKLQCLTHLFSVALI